jgi:DNA-binding GntR family transcriptional regulator
MTAKKRRARKTAKAAPQRTRHARLADVEVTDWLRASIIEGALPPGSRLSEVTIGNELGVSRTPVREALRVLASEDLIDWQPNRSAVVKPVSNDSVIEALDVLGALEQLAVRLVAARASDKKMARLEAAYARYRRQALDPSVPKYFGVNMHLHFALVEASGNPMLARAHRMVVTHLVRARHMINISGHHLSSSIHDHRQIMQSVFARNAAAAQKAIGVHIAHMKRDLLLGEKREGTRSQAVAARRRVRTRTAKPAKANAARR